MEEVARSPLLSAKIQGPTVYHQCACAQLVGGHCATDLGVLLHGL
jgi:hypothetical protein